MDFLSVVSTADWMAAKWVERMVWRPDATKALTSVGLLGLDWAARLGASEVVS